MATLKQVCSGNRSASCVQRFDDSRSAIRITYRISLRSSSSREPRYPLLKVVSVVCEDGRREGAPTRVRRGLHCKLVLPRVVQGWKKRGAGLPRPHHVGFAGGDAPQSSGAPRGGVGWGLGSRGNDPSAGSPTETLLRLHLPLDDEVYSTSRATPVQAQRTPDPEISPSHPIGRCDGRCVQRAGT